MRKLNVLPLTLCILGVSFLLVAMANKAPISAPDGVDIAASSFTAHEIRWLNGGSSVVNMYGTTDGLFYLHAGGNGAQILMNPGDVDTQHWYITGWQNNKGIKVFNDHTLFQNRLDVEDAGITTTGPIYAYDLIDTRSTIHANGAVDTDSTIHADGAISASNFSGSSSGTNTGDQTIKTAWGGTGLQNSVSASSTMYLGPFMSQPPDISAADTTWFVPFGGTLKNFRIRTLTIQPASGSLVVTIVVNGSDTAITVTVPANGATGVATDLTHTATVPAGSGVRIKLVNNATGASAQIGMFSMEFDQ